MYKLMYDVILQYVWLHNFKYKTTYFDVQVTHYKRGFNIEMGIWLCLDDKRFRFVS